MLSGNCTEVLSSQAIVTISCSSAKLIKNGIAPLPFPLPALLKQYWYIKRGERERVRRHAPSYATLGFICRRWPPLLTMNTQKLLPARRHLSSQLDPGEWFGTAYPRGLRPSRHF